MLITGPQLNIVLGGGEGEGRNLENVSKVYELISIHSRMLRWFSGLEIPIKNGNLFTKRPKMDSPRKHFMRNATTFQKHLPSFRYENCVYEHCRDAGAWVAGERLTCPFLMGQGGWSTLLTKYKAKIYLKIKLTMLTMKQGKLYVQFFIKDDVKLSPFCASVLLITKGDPQI